MKANERDELVPLSELKADEVPAGIDRRAFMMRTAMVGATAVLTGCESPATGTAAPPPTPPQIPAGAVSPDLDVKKKTKGPVMTVDRRVLQGWARSVELAHHRADAHHLRLLSAGGQAPRGSTRPSHALKVHLFGSLSATGKGHGTERAALAGIVGKEPATVEPAFLDSLASDPNQVFKVKLGSKTFDASLKDIIYDAPKGEWPHPNTMTCKLMAGDKVLLEQEYYSVGGGFIEWKGYTPPKKGQPKYPYSTMAELLKHANGAKISIAQLVMANEVAVSGKSEAEINAFIDKISNAMVAIVKSGLDAPSATLPGPIKLKTKAGDVYKRAMEDKFERQRGVGVVSAYALAGSEENARGHLVVTAPTGGSAGVMPALVYAVGEGGRKLPQDKIRNGFLAAAAIGYLCKHNATLSGAEGGCQAEIGVASAMGAAFLAQAHDEPNQVIANGAESALQHHLGMTCDPVAGFVQVPCIERCAFGAVKAWTGYLIARNEIPANRRLDFDTTLNAMALTAQGDEREVQGNL